MLPAVTVGRRFYFRTRVKPSRYGSSRRSNLDTDRSRCQGADRPGPNTGTTLLHRARSADVPVFRGTCVGADKGCAMLTGVGCAPACQAPLSQVDRSARHARRLQYKVATPRPFESSTRACPDPPCPAPRTPPLSRNLSRSSLALSATPCITLYFMGSSAFAKPRYHLLSTARKPARSWATHPLLRSREPAFKRL